MDIDNWYNAFVAIYHSEMNTFYKCLDDTPTSKKNYFIARKGWWNDELGKLVKETRLAEKEFLTLSRQNRRCNAAKRKSVTLQSDFDKLVKKSKRKWQRNQILGLEEANLNNPKEFWDYIKNLRRTKKAEIPQEVYTDGDHTVISDDPVDILNR